MLNMTAILKLKMAEPVGISELCPNRKNDPTGVPSFIISLYSEILLRLSRWTAV